MRTQLSSQLTFFYKFVFPGLWLAGFAFGTGAMLVTGKGPALAFALVLILGLLGLGFLCFPLKRVIAVDDGLLVSNFSHEVLIPYSLIGVIKENKWINIRPITLALKTSSRFGAKIVFMPYGRFLLPWQDHPAAELLRSRIAG